MLESTGGRIAPGTSPLGKFSGSAIVDCSIQARSTLADCVAHAVSTFTSFVCCAPGGMIELEDDSSLYGGNTATRIQAFARLFAS